MNISSVGNGANQTGAVSDITTPLTASPEQRTLIQAVKAVNAAELFGDDKEVTYVMDRQTKRMLTRVVNRNTGEIVMQIPPEYVLRLAEEMKGG